jgi:hypothetical protein
MIIFNLIGLTMLTACFAIAYVAGFGRVEQEASFRKAHTDQCRDRPGWHAQDEGCDLLSRQHRMKSLRWAGCDRRYQPRRKTIGTSVGSEMAESIDLAGRHPEKVTELSELWRR